MNCSREKTAEILNEKISVSANGDIKVQSQRYDGQKACTNQRNRRIRQLLWIASISLLVGGIGVMNIMLVSVTESNRGDWFEKSHSCKIREEFWDNFLQRQQYLPVSVVF